MKLKLLFLAFLVLSTSAIVEKSPVTIYMIGDSTMANRNLKNPKNKERGWGMMLGSFFPSDKVVVSNHAASGRSTKSFINEKDVYKRQPLSFVLNFHRGNNEEPLKSNAHTCQFL